MSGMNPNEMIPGRRYMIGFGEDMVSGELVGTFLGFEPEEGGAPTSKSGRFDFGVLNGITDSIMGGGFPYWITDVTP